VEHALVENDAARTTMLVHCSLPKTHYIPRHNAPVAALQLTVTAPPRNLATRLYDLTHLFPSLLISLTTNTAHQPSPPHH